MVPYHQDPKHAAHLHEAPRCQHTRLNGQRCGSPALRGENHCYFHNRIQRPAHQEDCTLPFIEDATSLQFALMQVMRMLQIGHVEYKRCALLLYSLQIAGANLKGFMAEQPKPELAEGEQPQPKPAGGEREKHGDGKHGDEPSLAELLLGPLAKPEGGPEAERPRIRSREDYYAAVEQRQHSSAALPGESVAP